MKVQLSLLVLGERGFLPFTLQLHDDLRADLEGNDFDQRSYMRDRLRRILRQHFGSETPMYFFVLEDRDAHGNPVRPHAHGAIEIKRFPVEKVSDPKARRRLLRLRAKLGVNVAELMAGRWVIRSAMRSAAGLVTRPRVASAGVDQSRNLWWRKPTMPIFNQDWVTYILKNVHQVSSVLSENRLVLPYDIMGEAKLLWAQTRG